MFRSVKLAQIVKKVLDTPILTEDGALAATAPNGYQDIRGLIEPEGTPAA